MRELRLKENNVETKNQGEQCGNEDSRRTMQNRRLKENSTEMKTQGDSTGCVWDMYWVCMGYVWNLLRPPGRRSGPGGLTQASRIVWFPDEDSRRTMRKQRLKENNAEMKTRGEQYGDEDSRRTSWKQRHKENNAETKKQGEQCRNEDSRRTIRK